MIFVVFVFGAPCNARLAAYGKRTGEGNAKPTPAATLGSACRRPQLSKADSHMHSASCRLLSTSYEGFLPGTLRTGLGTKCTPNAKHTWISRCHRKGLG